jgi:FMN phosphatase YigB (HAD superfamily)
VLTDRQSSTPSVTFLIDIDNTLLDNDRFADDLHDTLTQAFGADECKRYWTLYEAIRDSVGYADYLGALQRFRAGLENDPALLQMSRYLLDYPFAERLYPHALETLAHLRSLGPTAILSDGDIVFQPRKIQRSGAWDAVRGEVLVYIHKQHMLVAIQQRYPAAHYVMVDDKPQILTEMKRRMGDKLTTVFVEQGHYAADAVSEGLDLEPDMRIACIGDLRQRKLVDFLADAPVINLRAE